jgi:N-acetyl-beta-hexosaminidase
MIEFEVPGHSTSRCLSYPEVCTTCTSQSGSTLPLNPARNSTFQMIESLLGEMTGGSASTPDAPRGLCPGNMVHLGGDEVDADCFNRDPEIAAWMVKRGMKCHQCVRLLYAAVGAMAKA